MKGGIQAFATERGIDLSIRKLITEEYLDKIKENKQEPVLQPRAIVPSYAIAGLGCITLVALSSQIETGMPPMTM